MTKDRFISDRYTKETGTHNAEYIFRSWVSSVGMVIARELARTSSEDMNRYMQAHAISIATDKMYEYYDAYRRTMLRLSGEP